MPKHTNWRREARPCAGTELNPHFPQNEDKCSATIPKIKSVTCAALPGSHTHFNYIQIEPFYFYVLLFVVILTFLLQNGLVTISYAVKMFTAKGLVTKMFLASSLH